MFRFLITFVFSVATLGQSAFGQPAVCGNYDGCEPEILTVRGIVRDNLGTPLDGVVVTGTENRRRDLGAVEFFTHCGNSLHIASNVESGTSLSGSNPNPGSYELLFIVCADDRNDFAADFDICIDTPGYASACIVTTFDQGDDSEDRDFSLEPSAKGGPAAKVSEKGLPAGPCGSYDDCNMVLLKVRGNITAADGGAPVTNAVVTGTLTSSDNINAIQFYSHCGNGTHSLQSDPASTSTSSSSTQSGFYELLYLVCVEDSNDVLPDEFSVNTEIRVTAEGFEEGTGMAGFNEEDDRADRNIMLVAATVPTATPTPSPMETPTPTMMSAPTALNPAADVDGSGRIDHEDLLEILENWYRVVQ